VPGLGWRFEVFPAACEFAVLDWRYGYVVTKERFRVERWELGHIHAMSGMRLVTSTCVVCGGMERCNGKAEIGNFWSSILQDG